MDQAPISLQPFDVESCTATLERACQVVNYRSDDAELIRLGENAIFHLKHEGIVARIARGMDVLDDARKELRVARWLLAEGMATAPPTDVEQPLVVDQMPVTFWQFIEHTGEEATIAELGSMLRTLHRLDPPAALCLPAHDMFGRVDARIDRAADIPMADRWFLRARLRELRAAYSELDFPLRMGAVHGDAHTGNLLKLHDGSTSVIDLERFAYGHPETDLVVTGVELSMGWVSEEQYGEFVDAYGFDVTSWDGFDVLQAITELKMTTWLMQNIGHSAAIDTEICTRLSDLRDQSKPRHWNVF